VYFVGNVTIGMSDTAMYNGIVCDKRFKYHNIIMFMPFMAKLDEIGIKKSGFLNNLLSIKLTAKTYRYK